MLSAGLKDALAFLEWKGINRADLLWFTSFGKIPEQKEGGHKELSVKVVHKTTLLDNQKYLRYRSCLAFSRAGEVNSNKRLPLIE